MEEGHASTASPASQATFNVEQSPEDAGKPQLLRPRSDFSRRLFAAQLPHNIGSQMSGK